MNRHGHPRIADIQMRGPRRKGGRPKGSLTIDAATAALVRRVCRHDGYDLTAFVDAMLRAYVESHHRDWKLIDAGARSTE